MSSRIHGVFASNINGGRPAIGMTVSPFMIKTKYLALAGVLEILTAKFRLERG